MLLRQSPVRRLGVLNASLVMLAVGCRANPDVVATMETDAAAATDLNVQGGQQRCKPGYYMGHMNAVSDGGLAIPFSADINFSLVQNLGGEIPVLQDTSILSGNNANGIHFTAEITGGTQCAEGSFSTNVVNGMYWTSSDATMMPYTFAGTIAGTYTEYEGFSGTWQTTMHLPNNFDLPVSGKWSANYAGPVPTMN